MFVLSLYPFLQVPAGWGEGGKLVWVSGREAGRQARCASDCNLRTVQSTPGGGGKRIGRVVMVGGDTVIIMEGERRHAVIEGGREYGNGGGEAKYGN